jgi:hypothetical protein
MRWTCWVFALLAVSALVTPAVGLEENHGAAGLSGGCASCGASGAAAYAAPGGFGLVPGCCACQPSCCDNAWAGYCLQKARWQAFWARVGIPRPGCRWVSCCEAVIGCAECDHGSSSPAPQPLPTTPKEPAGAPLQPTPAVPTAVRAKPPDSAFPAAVRSAPTEGSWSWRAPGFR